MSNKPRFVLLEDRKKVRIIFSDGAMLSASVDEVDHLIHGLRELRGHLEPSSSSKHEFEKRAEAILDPL